MPHRAAAPRERGRTGAPTIVEVRRRRPRRGDERVDRRAGAPPVTTRVLAEYVATALDRPLPDDVAERATDHLVDTVAAIVSGSVLPAGRHGQALARAHGGSPQATVLGTGLRTDTAHAALANGMAAHADETDDSHEPSRTHPGCSIVPAALAVAESAGAPGRSLLRAVALGYDVCARTTRALWPDFTALRATRHSTHAIGGLFGSAATAGALADLGPARLAHLFSYACQRASGTTAWLRDAEHVQKAYVFAGMPASDGVQLARLVAAGWPGIDEPFTGESGFLDVIGEDADPDVLTAGLGTDYAVARTNIKWLPVGSPIQAPAQALLEVMRTHHLSGTDVTGVEVVLPGSLAHVVDSRDMPDIDLAYVLGVILTDGRLTFAAVHDMRRFSSWRGGGGDPRITIRTDAGMQPLRQAHVVVRAGDRSLAHRVTAIHGSPRDPMSSAEVDGKARELVAPVLGADQADLLVTTLRGVARMSDHGWTDVLDRPAPSADTRGAPCTN
ncbi:MAG: MmgE/PrpD family protein [Streptosporangiales bacterium]|nr:MmgE/PrpD family protein [Streptosporangiales bacterium]